MSEEQKQGTIKKAEIEQENRNFIQLLTFCQNSEIYAIHIEAVREVIDTIDITPIPLVPNYIRGVINLRGNVLPVVDLTARFFNHQSEIGKFTNIVVLEVKSGDELVIVGLMIDAVKEVVMFPEDQIDATPDFGTRIRTDYIAGVARHADNYLILLDIDTLLNIEELADFNCAISSGEVTHG